MDCTRMEWKGIKWIPPDWNEIECNGMEWKDPKSTRLNSSHLVISYAVFCLKKKKKPKDLGNVRSGCLRTDGGRQVSPGYGCAAVEAWEQSGTRRHCRGDIKRRLERNHYAAS